MRTFRDITWFVFGLAFACFADKTIDLQFLDVPAFAGAAVCGGAWLLVAYRRRQQPNSDD